MTQIKTSQIVDGISVIKVPLRTPCCNVQVGPAYISPFPFKTKTIQRACLKPDCTGVMWHRRQYEVTITITNPPDKCQVEWLCINEPEPKDEPERDMSRVMSGSRI